MTRFSPVLSITMLMALSGCASVMDMFGRGQAPDTPPPAAEVAPEPAPAVPAANATTVEAFDTTTAAQRTAAAAPVERPARELGTIVASLGDPSEPGFWTKTSLVTEVQQGRLVYPDTGKSVLVELRPLPEGGDAGQVSLAALRVLGAPLTALPKLTVFDRR